MPKADGYHVAYVPDPRRRRRRLPTAGKTVGSTQRAGPLGLLIAILTLPTAGCAGRDHGMLDAAVVAATSSGLVRQEIDTGRFRLASWHRGLQGARQITVYLEGDGHAWLSRRRLSEDPTPLDPLALRLAARDPGSAVLYLARPCQFGGVASDPACDVRYWSSHRYAPEVIASMGAALDWARARAGPSVRFGLVGYSGGGALAALLAEQRDDVAWLLTIAANLDTEAWTRHHGLSALTGSLDPVAHADRLRGLPQKHLVGSNDDVVPGFTQARFLAAAGAEQRSVDGATHVCCWVRSWPRPLCGFMAAIAAAPDSAQTNLAGICR